MVKSHNFRETGTGDTNDLQLQIKELNTQLRDRKHANVVLNTENQRLKREVHDLQQRMADIEMGRDGKKGEHASAAALRMAAIQQKQRAVAISQDFNQALEANQALMDHVSALDAQVSDLQAQLETANAGWAATRKEVVGLHDLTDKQEVDIIKLKAEAEEAKQQMGEMAQALSLEQAARAAGEGQVALLTALVEQVKREGESKAAEEVEALTKAHTTALQQALAAKQGVMDAEVAARDATIAALRSHMDHVRARTRPATPPALTLHRRTLLPAAVGGGVAAGVPSTVPAAAATATPQMTGAGPGAPPPPLPHTPPTPSVGVTPQGLSPGSNAVEIVAHSLSLDPTSTNLDPSAFWLLLAMHAPAVGIGGETVRVAGDARPSSLQLDEVYRLGMGGGEEVGEELAVINGGAVVWAVHNLRTAVVGALRCPVPAGAPHPLQGQVVPALACVTNYAPGVTKVEVVEFLEEEGRVGGVLAVLSTDWQVVMPPGTAAPQASEFVVDLRGVDVLLMEGVRISGLFTPGRSFTGTDLRTYQVWAPAPEPARAAATARCLPPGAAVTVCADVGLASQPAATATMPLSLALASPSRAQVQAQLLQQALSQPFPQAMPQQQQHQQQQPQNPTQPQPPPAPTAQVPTHAYSPASEHGTRTLTLRTPLGHPLATLTVTPRMLEAVTVSQPLLQQLQAPPPAAVMAAVGAGGAAFTQIPPPSPAPAGAAAGPDAGVGALAGSVGGEEHHARALGSPSARFQPAPLLPAQHWASSMAAEEVCAGKMAADMCARAVDAVKKVLAGPAPDPQALDECQQAVLQVVDAVHVQTEQLQGSLSSCAAIASRAATASPEEGDLALSWVGDVAAMVHRRVSCALLEVHQRNSLAGLCEEVWAMVASTTPAPTPTPSPAIGGTEGTVAASGRAGGALAPGPLPGPQQVQMAASLEGALATAVHRLLNGPGHHTPPSLAALYAQAAAAAARAPPSPMRPLDTLPPGSAPPNPHTATATPTAATVAAAAVTATTLQGAIARLVSDMQAVVDESAGAAGALFDTARKHLAAPPPGTPGDGHDIIATALQQAHTQLAQIPATLCNGLCSLAPALLAQLLAEPEARSVLPAGPFGAAPSTAHDSRLASVEGGPVHAVQALTRLMVSLEAVMQRLVSKADPTLLPPATPATAAAWCKGGHRLQAQLLAVCGVVSGVVAAFAGHTLASLGQRTGAVMWVMEGMGEHAVQVAQATQAVMSKLRVSKVYDAPLVDACLPAFAASFEKALVSACLLPYHLALQLLLAPLVLRPLRSTTHHPHSGPHPHPGPHWSGPPLFLPVSGAHQVDLVWDGTGAGHATDREEGAPEEGPHPDAHAAGVLGGLRLHPWLPHRLMVLVAPSAPAGPHPARGGAGALVMAAARLGLGCRTLEEVAGGVAGAEGTQERERIAGVAGVCDFAVVAMDEQDAGSSIKWVSSGGFPVLRPSQDPPLQAAITRAVLEADTPAHASVTALAQLLAARVARHMMGRVERAVRGGGAAGGQGDHGGGAGGGGVGGGGGGGGRGGWEEPRSAARTPRTSFAGSVESMSGRPLQARASFGGGGGGGGGGSAAFAVSGAPATQLPLGPPPSTVVSTCLQDSGGVKPLVAASRQLHRRVTDAVQLLHSSFSAASPVMASAVTAMAQAAQHSVNTHQLMLEGCLLAADPPPPPPPPAVTPPRTTPSPLPTFRRATPASSRAQSIAGAAAAGFAAPVAAGALTGPVPPSAEALAALAAQQPAPVRPAGADYASTVSEAEEAFVLRPVVKPAAGYAASEMDSEVSMHRW